MTIGEVIRRYREDHNLSQRQFALKCNISNGYISMLEKGINPKTNEPIMPSIAALKAISSAMNISLNDLLIQADDMPVNLSLELELQSSSRDDSRLLEFVDLFQKLTNEQQSLIISQIKGILSNQ
nr:MAG TPA: helix-turn-helix domain protein [Caudoviricetes sp.]